MNTSDKPIRIFTLHILRWKYLVLTSFINVIRFIGVLKEFWLIVVYEVGSIIPWFLTIINWRMFFYSSVFCFIGNLISDSLLAGFYKRRFKMSKQTNVSFIWNTINSSINTNNNTDNTNNNTNHTRINWSNNFKFLRINYLF